MRRSLFSVLLVVVAASPALASGRAKQSPLLGHRAGAACAPGHPRLAFEGSYAMAGCLKRYR